MSRGARLPVRLAPVGTLVLFGCAAWVAGTVARAEDAPTDELVQRYVDQYGDLRCSDFDNRQQAQEVFEIDQIVFGDALDPDIPKEGGAKRATLLKAGGPEGRELPSPSCRAVLLS
jgi:hypothetical protein